MDPARGLLMLSYATLTQLAAEDGEICFHAIICLDNKRLCHAKFCMKAQGLLDLVPTGFKQMPASGDSGAPKKQVRPLQDGPYLVPNPARDEVTVMGIAPESVAEITVLTMDGRQTAVFRNDCRFDVSHIDRKSTRLNSSHQIISYAVLCLKKKNNDIPVSFQLIWETDGLRPLGSTRIR